MTISRFAIVQIVIIVASLAFAFFMTRDYTLPAKADSKDSKKVLEPPRYCEAEKIGHELYKIKEGK